MAAREPLRVPRPYEDAFVRALQGRGGADGCFAGGDDLMAALLRAGRSLIAPVPSGLAQIILTGLSRVRNTAQ